MEMTKQIPTDTIPVDGTNNNEAISINSISAIESIKVRKPIKTWEDYVEKLPLWEQQLLSDIKIYSTEKLLKVLKEKEKIYLCSDGGAVNRVGSFRALITSATEILMEIKGKAYGHTPRSFCSEAYGTLSNL